MSENVWGDTCTQREKNMKIVAETNGFVCEYVFFLRLFLYDIGGVKQKIVLYM